jgi:hypothetical protein
MRCSSSKLKHSKQRFLSPRFETGMCQIKGYCLIITPLFSVLTYSWSSFTQCIITYFLSHDTSCEFGAAFLSSKTPALRYDPTRRHLAIVRATFCETRLRVFMSAMLAELIQLTWAIGHANHNNLNTKATPFSYNSDKTREPSYFYSCVKIYTTRWRRVYVNRVHVANIGNMNIRTSVCIYLFLYFPLTYTSLKEKT